MAIARFKNADSDYVTSYVLRKIYEGIGYQVEFVDFPGKQSLVQANAGKAAGESMRRSGLSKRFPNLIQLSHPHVELHFKLYTLPDSLVFKDPTNWKNAKIGIVKGVIIAEELTKGLDTVQYQSVGELFNKLSLGEIDVAIATDLIGGLELLINYPGVEIKSVGPSLNTVLLYHYVHKDHAALVPLLNGEIVELKSNGQLQKLYQEAFNLLRLSKP